MVLTKKEYQELIRLFKKQTNRERLTDKQVGRELDLKDKATAKQWYAAMNKAGLT